MKISFENPDKINGKLTLTVEEADYNDEVVKTLKDYRKRANVPGFRPGNAPMGLIKRQYGTAVKVDVVNKVVSDNLNKYIQDNKINMLGEPLPSEDQKPQDLEKDTEYTFNFDIAVAPEFKIELNGHNKIDYYNIKVDDDLINRQIDAFASQNGKYAKAETYTAGDTLKGDLRELDESGNTKEGGLTVEGAVLMPEYIKDDEQKKLFDNVKPGDIVTFNPRKAYPDNDTEVSSLLKIDRDKVGEHTGDFSYQITEINHFEKAVVDQSLFDKVFGKDAVKSEDEFRSKIAEGIKSQLVYDQDYKFLQDVRAYCEKKVGKLEYPDALLKRIMLANNKERGEEFVEKNYDDSIKELTWSLIRNQLALGFGIKVDDNDVKNVARQVARAQFAQYGMTNVPDEYVDNYANEMLKKRENAQGFADRAVDEKLTQAVKQAVKLNEKEITLDDFNKMMETK